MDATDVISLQDAKDWLIVTDNDDSTNKQITRLIKTAIAWVEQYTDYRLYERTETITTGLYSRNTSYAQFPIAIDSAKDKDGNDVTYTSRTGPLVLDVCCSPDTTLSFTVGYDDPTDIPGPLIDGALKWITYLWENRDIYEFAIPGDVQVILNQYRRSVGI